mmetsp:Transcript_150453/g.483546  ORF Transcript_150453/g.483546 Transcript_150453/m.483546 type:complete len:379 (-) Transcript_150453:201-1337(-)|eukprot:CAMPEP_0203952610 /NCGR_PEP_ID=MMETSP0359-20131031/86210_1 /ASSEMBLY_ACC=CAM_ASM_000338 /TAXON_ID=268821 /ORGANISM="Scrippsiella Hangoei, Strain SHTV-5" /LENGTH=378 /DNA_ID=CAMNT_0050885653 /DNA_START=127 /DNA_END=1263 /DNA_ORIENTATION=+
MTSHRSKAPRGQDHSTEGGLFGPAQMRLQAGSRVHWPVAGAAAATKRSAPKTDEGTRHEDGLADGSRCSGAAGKRREGTSAGGRREESRSPSSGARAQRPHRSGREHAAAMGGGREVHRDGHRELFPDLRLRIPSNCNLTGYLKRIRAELRAVVVEQEPLVPPEHFLDEPSVSNGHVQEDVSYFENDLEEVPTGKRRSHKLSQLEADLEETPDARRRSDAKRSRERSEFDDEVPGPSFGRSVCEAASERQGHQESSLTGASALLPIGDHRSPHRSRSPQARNELNSADGVARHPCDLFACSPAAEPELRSHFDPFGGEFASRGPCIESPRPRQFAADQQPRPKGLFSDDSDHMGWRAPNMLALEDYRPEHQGRSDFRL